LRGQICIDSKHDVLLRALSRIGFAKPVNAWWGMISGRQILKIAAIIYIAQAAIAFAIGFTLPFLLHFGVL
jgi:hypothetical protein